MDAYELVSVLREGKGSPTLESYIQALSETLESLRPSSQGDQRRLEIAKENLRNVRRMSVRLRSKNQELEEQLRVLEEGE